MPARTNARTTNQILAEYTHELDQGRCSAEMLSEVLDLVVDTALERTDDAGAQARDAVARSILRALVENGHAGAVAEFLNRARREREAAAARYEASQASHAHGAA